MSQGYTKGVPIDTDVTLSGNSDFVTASQKAIKTYVDLATSVFTTRIQNGINIYTGGTVVYPTINLVDSPSVNNLTFSGTATGNALSATTLSGGTIYSGSTNLSNIFAVASLIKNGLNTYTGGTTSLPTINVSALTYVDTLTVSGDTSIQGASASTLSITTSLTASTFYVAPVFASTSVSVNNLGQLNVGTTSLSANGLSKVRIMNAGTGTVDIGDATGVRGCIWLNQSAQTSTNWAIAGDVANSTFINSATQVKIGIAGTSYITVSNQLMSFGSGATSYDLTFTSTNGTKFSVNTTDKLAFWNSLPIARPTSGTPINTVFTNLGLMQSGATNVQLSLPVSISGNTTLANIGNKLIIASGSNASVGVVTLVAGTATVNNTLVTNGSTITLTPQTLGTITRPVGLGVTGRTAGVSFTIVSQDVTDTSIVGWMIVEPL